MKDEPALRALLKQDTHARSRGQPAADRPARSGPAAVHVREALEGEWNGLYRAVPHPHLPQSHAYGEGKRCSGRWFPVRLLFLRGGRPIALCQALEVRVAGLCVAVRINRGPQFLDPAPSWEEREQVMRLLRRHWHRWNGGPLLIAPALEESEDHRALMRSLGFRQRRRDGWCSSLIDLHLSDDEIRRRMASVWRNRLKAALGSGMSLRVADDSQTMEWMLDRHEENMREKGFAGPRRALLRALHRVGGDQFRVLQAIAGDTPVGGLILARFGCAAEYYVGWFGEQGRRHNCGNFLYWHAMQEARRSGHRWFDLGGYYSSDKFGRFKQNLRGTEYRLCGEWVGV